MGLSFYAFMTPVKRQSFSRKVYSLQWHMKRKDWVNHQRNTKNTGGPDHCSVKIISQVFWDAELLGHIIELNNFYQYRRGIPLVMETLLYMQSRIQHYPGAKSNHQGEKKREGVIHFSPSIFDNDQTRSSNSKTQHNFIIRNSISQIVP